MISQVEMTCVCGCGKKRMVRTADVKRGWGRYFNKKCKARHQVATKGTNYANGHAGESKYKLPGGGYDYWEEYLDSMHPFSSEALGQS